MPPLVPDSPEKGTPAFNGGRWKCPDVGCPLRRGSAPFGRGTPYSAVLIPCTTIVPRAGKELTGRERAKGDVSLMIAEGPARVSGYLLLNPSEIREDSMKDRDV